MNEFILGLIHVPEQVPSWFDQHLHKVSRLIFKLKSSQCDYLTVEGTLDEECFDQMEKYSITTYTPSYDTNLLYDTDININNKYISYC